MTIWECSNPHQELNQELLFRRKPSQKWGTVNRFQSLNTIVATYIYCFIAILLLGRSMCKLKEIFKTPINYFLNPRKLLCLLSPFFFTSWCALPDLGLVLSLPWVTASGIRLLCLECCRLWSSSGSSSTSSSSSSSSSLSSCILGGWEYGFGAGVLR